MPLCFVNLCTGFYRFSVILYWILGTGSEVVIDDSLFYFAFENPVLSNFLADSGKLIFAEITIFGIL